ncbi:hypothetical protein VPNG_02896 [Cytospora leucostoma]|uniref:Uncharacterized protein n=1 Tax=Cytospora leucostoma TaxID=1230097 RepID=A0A423XJJ6_9PEZI|nr:hypothetical protein VPNG_02896 [Cytospora leucostoma]
MGKKEVGFLIANCASTTNTSMSTPSLNKPAGKVSRHLNYAQPKQEWSPVTLDSRQRKQPQPSMNPLWRYTLTAS